MQLWVFYRGNSVISARTFRVGGILFFPDSAWLHFEKRFQHAGGGTVPNIETQWCLPSSCWFERLSRGLWITWDFPRQRGKVRYFANQDSIPTAFVLARWLEFSNRSAFICTLPSVLRWERLPTPRDKLDSSFRQLTDDDLLVSDFDILLKKL